MRFAKNIFMPSNTNKMCSVVYCQIGFLMKTITELFKWMNLEAALIIFITDYELIVA